MSIFTQKLPFQSVLLRCAALLLLLGFANAGHSQTTTDSTATGTATADSAQASHPPEEWNAMWNNKRFYQMGIGPWIPRKNGFGINHKMGRPQFNLELGKWQIRNRWLDVGYSAAFSITRHSLREHLEEKKTTVSHFYLGGRIGTGKALFPNSQFFISQYFGILWENEQGVDTHGQPKGNLSTVTAPGYIHSFGKDLVFGGKLEITASYDPVFDTRTFIWVCPTIFYQMHF